MRLTIVDRSTFMVMEVLEGDVAFVRNNLEWLSGYSHGIYQWFVSRTGCQPEHAQHNAHGQLLSRAGKPIRSFTPVKAASHTTSMGEQTDDTR